MGGENVEKAKNGGAGQARAAVPLALLFAAIVIASFTISSSRIKENEARLCEGVAYNASEELVAFVDGLAASGSPLAAAIGENPALWKGGVDAMARAILDERPYVVGVSVAPSAIVKYHFPEEGNESLVGHDLLSNPERRDALTAAAERRAPVLSGPDESVDGRRVLFIRYPVFAGGKLWGFTSLTVDFEAMLESLALEKHFPGFSFALSDKGYIGGAKEAFADGRVSAAVELPGAEWTLHVIPAAGWSPLDPFLLVLLIAGIAGALLFFVALRRKPAAAAGAPRVPAPASSRARDVSAFDLAVREAEQLNASRERSWQGGGGESSDRSNEAGPVEIDASKDSAPPPPLERKAVRLETSDGGAAYGVAEYGASRADAQTPALDRGKAADAGVEPAEAKKNREVKFIGPDVRGELYMPERIVSGEPGSLFARFAIAEREEGKADAKSAPEAISAPATAQATAQAKPSERPTIPERGVPLALKSQKEFPFTVEEPAPAKAENAAKALAILVVDDSEANREIMGRMLALRGFQADFAVSGEESLERCSSRAYDIVFMDCFMPGMDGYKASATLRERFSSRVRRIVGMSARIGDQELDRCRQAGMDDLLAKPFTLKQLLTHLERL